MDEHSFSKAREFTLANARLLEQRAFATLFEGAPAQGIVDALRGYQNEDGGFGHGLEPDKRCPASLPIDVEALLRVAIFLAHVPDQGRAMSLRGAVAEHLPKTQYYRAEADDPAYGLTPLNFALTTESPWRSIFDDTVIARHLDRLERDQQDDGGWAITWEPPSPAAVLEYRGVQTMWALRVLRAYGRT